MLKPCWPLPPHSRKTERGAIRCLPGLAMRAAPIALLALLAIAVSAQDDEEGAKPAAPAAGGMEYRAIGPFRGGRSLTASGIPGDPKTYYFGSTGGGVWKSTDGAITWKPIFDKEGSATIGGLAVSPSDPNVVYAGTGEGCIRGDAAQGDGVYKSIDAGKTWKNVGLKDSRAVGKLIVHPKNPDIAFVAALGHVYGPNAERGVFRTLDGGKTWTKVLYVDDKTGAIDVVFDPNNPNILFAAMWQVYRTPWSLESGGPGSGLYRSADGGSTWKKITPEQGLPKGIYGRIGVAVGANSDRVWALVETKEGGGLYRSDDGGGKWALINGEHRLTQRAWYYMHVVADPKDANVLYVMNVEFVRSIDGGRTFNRIHVPHGDNHGLWIDPLDTNRMIQSDDGGATVSLDGGKSWTTQENQPTAQFYHVITDNQFPYYVYGAQQDNTTIAIASQGPEGSIGRPEWYDVGGGESGYIAPDPRDPAIVYASGYQGNITRYDKHDGQLQDITVFPQLTDGKGAAILDHRFQWTSPVLISLHDPKVLYHAGERLFESTDNGMSWKAISGDLTRNDKTKQKPSGGPVNIDDTGTEFYDTIFAVAESPVEKGLIWAGADDGLVHVTRDGGKSWSDVTPKEMPEWSRVSLIEASPQAAGTAYLAIDRHENDDLRPYIYKTADFGKSWTLITQGIPEGAFVRAVREDPVRNDLLFAGTQNGVFVSYDGGGKWQSLQLNLPMTPVHDLAVKGDDLVVATHGRAFWILDDISPIRQHSEEIAAEAVHLYKPATALRLHSGRRGPSATAGANPPNGAILYFAAKTKPKTAMLEVINAKGATVRSYSTERFVHLEGPLDPGDEKPHKEMEVKQGMNRLVWDLRYDATPRVKDYYLYDYEGGSHGPMALPGKYTVKLTVDGKSYTAPLELKMDPRVKTPLGELEKQLALGLEIRSQLTTVYGAVNQMLDLRAQIAGMRERVKGTAAESLIPAIDELEKKLAAAEEPLINAKVSASEDSLAYPLGLDGDLAYLGDMVNGRADTAPTEAEYQEFKRLKGEVEERLLSWNVLRKNDVPALEKQAQAKGVGAVFVVPAGN